MIEVMVEKELSFDASSGNGRIIRNHFQLSNYKFKL